MSLLGNRDPARPFGASESRSRTRRSTTGTGIAAAALGLLLSIAWAAARAEEGPDAAMMAPVTALANFMAHSPGATRPSVFVDDGAIIVENFFPYLFRGAGAANRWAKIFQQHAVDHQLRDLVYSFGAPQDFDRTGDRVYFVLPTRWTGSYRRGGEPRESFDETGAWTFVLLKQSGEWRIGSYAWGVTGKSAT